MAALVEVSGSDQLETQESTSQNLALRLILNHYWLLILGAVAGCVVGVLYYAKATPVFQANAQILVINKSQNRLPLNGDRSGVETGSEGSDFLATHQTLIRSPLVVSDAVQAADLANLPSFEGKLNPGSEIISALKLSRDSNNGVPTNILNVSFRTSHAEDAATIVTAIIESYQRFLKNRYRTGADETAKLISDANTILADKIAQKQKDYDAFLAQLPTDLWKSKDGYNSMQVLLINLEAKRIDFINRAADLEGRLQAIDKAMKEGHYSRVELLTMISQTSASGIATGHVDSHTTDRLMALKLLEKTLSEDYGPDHPEVRSVREELDFLRGRVKHSNGVSGSNDSTGGDPLTSHLQALKLELEYLRTASETTAKLLQKAHKQAKPLLALERMNELHRNDLGRHEHLFDAIAKRLDEVSILQNIDGGFEAEVINAPGIGTKVAPKAAVVFPCAIFLGLLAGLGLAYMAEISDQSFRTPEEIRRQLGVPVVGHIPFYATLEDKENLLTANGLQVDPSLCTVHRPKSREAEAYRSVRTALFFFNRAKGHALIQVTSPDMGDGKSTLITNLAISIAQAEKTVILIDADFRRPRIHKLFNTSAGQGLASVIGGEAELNDVILDSLIPGLSILPCGPTPPNPAELLSSPRFKEVLGYLREKYDMVLIDTPPLLAVTDPCVVMPHVDGVILTLRTSKHARPHALRAKEILSTMGAHLIGAVVNGIRTDTKSYGYGGSYTYRYQYQEYYSSDGGDAERTGANEAMDTNNQPSVSGQSSRRRTGFFAWLLNR
ncbi:MAG TPA: polysaccharide biosynthesis tyrosine autokinase [Gemmataceae bacterium]